MASQLPKVPECQNCQTPTPGNHCPNCGQDSREHRVSRRLLAREFFGDVLTFDSRFFRSLIPLLIKPGRLTEEYLRGRRQRYFPPLRLYLFTSIGFFFLLSVQVKGRLDEVGRAEGATADLLAAAVEVVPETGADSTEAVPQNTIMWREVERPMRDLVRPALNMAPKGVFFLLLALIYVRMKRMFIEHLIFTLHYHALFFLLFALALLVPWDWFDLAMIIAPSVYLSFAMRRVYQQGWWKTLLKHFLLTSAYNLVLLFFLAVMFGSSAALLELSEKHPWLRVFLA